MAYEDPKYPDKWILDSIPRLRRLAAKLAKAESDRRDEVTLASREHQAELDVIRERFGGRLPEATPPALRSVTTHHVSQADEDSWRTLVSAHRARLAEIDRNHREPIREAQAALDIAYKDVRESGELLDRAVEVTIASHAEVAPLVEKLLAATDRREQAGVVARTLDPRRSARHVFITRSDSSLETAIRSTASYDIRGIERIRDARKEVASE